MHPMFKTVTQGEGILSGHPSFRSAFTSSEPTVGFAITGGRFAESIDFSGDQLIGVIIIGLGLAPRSTLSDVISERANEEGRVNGFDAGYRLGVDAHGSNRWSRDSWQQTGRGPVGGPSF